MSIHRRCDISMAWPPVRVGALVAARDPAKPIRMLEVGAGTGSSTASLLPFLPADRARIFGTLTSPRPFFDRARERFSAFPVSSLRQTEYGTWPPKQGFPAGAFDIVFSSNTVHATRNIKASLKRLRTLLAPNGTLLLA